MMEGGCGFWTVMGSENLVSQLYRSRKDASMMIVAPDRCMERLVTGMKST